MRDAEEKGTLLEDFLGDTRIRSINAMILVNHGLFRESRGTAGH